MIQSLRLRISPARKGLTLTESAITLGIVGLVLGGVWTAASAVRYNMALGQAQSQIAMIAQNMRSLYAGRTQTSYPVGVNVDITAPMINAEVFPSETLVKSGTTTVSYTPWKGQYFLWIWGNTLRFVIGVGAPFPGTSCRDLANRFVGRDIVSNGLEQIRVMINGMGLTTYDAAALQNMGPSTTFPNCTYMQLVYRLKG